MVKKEKVEDGLNLELPQSEKVAMYSPTGKSAAETMTLPLPLHLTIVVSPLKTTTILTLATVTPVK